MTTSQNRNCIHWKKSLRWSAALLIRLCDSERLPTETEDLNWRSGNLEIVQWVTAAFSETFWASAAADTDRFPCLAWGEHPYPQSIAKYDKAPGLLSTRLSYISFVPLAALHFGAAAPALRLASAVLQDIFKRSKNDYMFRRLSHEYNFTALTHSLGPWW